MSFNLAAEMSKLVNAAEPARASITCEEVSALSIGDVAFNPDSFTLTRNIPWDTTGWDGAPWGAMHYTGGSADTLSVTLLLDQSEYRPTTLMQRTALSLAPVAGDAASRKLAQRVGWYNADSVTYEMRQLYELTLPVKATNGSNSAMRPPSVLFSWGDFSFRGVLSNVIFTATLFDLDGNPRRATATLTFTGRAGFETTYTDVFDPSYEPEHTAKQSASSGGDARLSLLSS